MGRSRGRRDTARNDRGPWQRGSDHSLGRDSREFPDLLILFGRLLRPNVHNGKESGNVIPKWTRCLRNKNQHGGGVAVLAGMAAASIANSGTIHNISIQRVSRDRVLHFYQIPEAKAEDSYGFHCKLDELNHLVWSRRSG
ncbi:hypothetical protein NC652_005957 [Populus alba x Populus x berolinensis]|nr:hypothetical protein NC652_005957 [Populus alba x Populus x berolinensis]